MLDTDGIDRVRGDGTAGFFRRRDASSAGGYVQEAYSWGGLTSRSASRAWWVLLAPFAFVNVAGWMLPDGKEHARRHKFATGLLRLLGLLLTVHAVIWIGQMTVDFASWQCGASATCRSSNWIVSIFDWSWFRGAPGRRITLGMVGPIAALAVFRWLTYRAVDRYETVTPDALDDYGPAVPTEDEADSFADPTFWRRGESVRSFASLHLAGSAAAITWLVAWTFAWLQPTGMPWIQYGLGAGAFLLFLTAAYGVSMGGIQSPSAGEGLPQWLIDLVRWHWVATAVIVGLTLVSGVVWPGYEDPARTGPLDPYGNLWTYLWVATFGVVVVFGFVVWTYRTRPGTVQSPIVGTPGEGTIEVGFWSIGSIVSALFGFLVAHVMLGSFGAAAARLFGGRPTIHYSYLYDAFAVVAGLWLLVLIAALGVAWLVRAETPIEAVERDVVGDFSEDERSFATGPKRKRKWLTSVRRMRDVRAFIPRAESVFGVMVLVAVGLALGVVVLLRFEGPSTWFQALATGPWVTGFVWVLAVGVPLGLIAIVRRAYGSRQARKTIGTLWDVVTFWPRWFHPLAPPSYSGRSIPELRTRLEYLTSNTEAGDHEASVVLTAHSQGSVVALASLDGVRGQEWFGQVALLTHGSPITRLYVRYFPVHMIPAISRVHNEIGQDRWLNLYRLTDPIGGAISGETEAGLPLSDLSPDGWDGFSNPVADPDLRLASEAGPDGAPMYPKKGDPYPAAFGHPGYFRAAEFQIAVRRLLDLPY